MHPRYRGFHIIPRPYQIYRTGLWTVNLEIHRRQHHRSYSFDMACQTELEAIDRCVRLGREIIDGQVKGYSVTSLRAATRFSLRQLVIVCSLVIFLSAFTYGADGSPFTLARVEQVGQWLVSAALIISVAVLGNSTGGMR